MRLAREMDAAAGVLIVHTSDLHLGSEVHGGDVPNARSLSPLSSVLAAARGADVLLVAGDMFDNNRVSTPFVDACAARLSKRRSRS